MAAAACDICTELYTKRRAPLACQYCQQAACMTCVQLAYDADADSQWGRCMFCSKHWTREFVDSVFPAAFRTLTLKMRRENKLLSMEKSLLPDTQKYVQLHRLGKELLVRRDERRAQRIAVEEEVRELDLRIGRANAHDLTLLTADPLSEEVEKRIKKRSRSRTPVAPPRSPKAGSSEETTSAADVNKADDEKEKAEKATATVGPCPRADCRGFLQVSLSTADPACGLCSIDVCAKCHVELVRPHMCQPDDVASVALVRQETKPCPNCAVRIYKVSGCDQMWCPQCHNAFSWRSGLLEKGPIHNPHWFQWVQTQRVGTVQDLATRQTLCPADFEGIPNYGTLRRMGRLFEPVADVLCLVAHIKGVTIVDLRKKVERGPRANLDLRVRFMQGEIDEVAWKRLLQQREKRITMQQEIAQVLDVLVMGASTLVRSVLIAEGDTTWRELVLTVPKELEELREYVNTSMMAIAERYASKATVLVDRQWRMVDNISRVVCPDS